MRAFSSIVLTLRALPCAWASDFAISRGETQGESFIDTVADGRIWLRTMITPLDEARREETYKVYTHIYDFDGAAPITKGPGGKYTHHRGLFIGWKDTIVDGKDYDTWHMSNCAQRFVRQDGATEEGELRLKIDWLDEEGKPFIEELRRIDARGGGPRIRVIDFDSTLISRHGTIELKGDLQHAGMQLRMANEVSEHEESTQYILPEGANELENDNVVGAWWTCCSCIVAGKRYWLVHMTHPELTTGPPVYSIRRYARFGAFFEPTIEEERPQTFRFRIIVSGEELDRAACENLYQTYAQGN